MSISTIIQHCLTGISLGGAYALIAIGYTMVYGILRLINFAHGDIFMMAGYFMIFAMASFPWYIAIPITLLATVALGVVIEKVAYKPLRTAPRMSIMISAIGVSYLLQNLATYLFTALPKGYPEIPVLKKIYQFGDVSASLVTFITPVLTIVLVIILMQLINHTKMGMAMRAVSKDYDTAQIMGIKINNVISYTFVIGSLLAGIGSILYFTDRMTVYPYSGSLPGLKCFVAAVLGGIGSIPGAMLGGLILGIIESLAKAYISTQLSDAIVFSVLVIVLLVKPSGLLGKMKIEKV